MQYDGIEQALARFNDRENANEVAEGAFLGAAAAGIMVARENQKTTLSAIESASENAARTIGDAVVSASSAAIREIVSSIGTVVQSAFEVESDAKASPLLQRAFIFLEDGERDRALEYLDRVLDLKPTCSRAYLGMFMLGKGIARIEEIPRIESSDYRRSILPDFPDFEKAIRFALEEERSLLVELQQSQLKVTRLRFCEDADEGIKIGNQYLSEGKFSDAEEFYANLQMLHPDEPCACLGLLLCKYKVRVPEDLAKAIKGTAINKAAVENEPLYIKLVGMCDEKLRAQLQSVRDRQIQIKQGQEYSRIKQLYEAASGLDDYRKAMDAASPLAALGHEGAKGIVSKCEKAIRQIKVNQELLTCANKEVEIGSRRGLTRALEILSKALPWAPAVERAEAIKARLAEMTVAQEERRIEAQGLFAEFCKMQSELDGDMYDGGCSSVLTCLLCDDAIILAVDKDMPAGLFESIKEMSLTATSQALMDDLNGFSGDTLSQIGAESLSEITVPQISNKDALDCLSSCRLALIDRTSLVKKTTLVRNELVRDKHDEIEKRFNPIIAKLKTEVLELKQRIRAVSEANNALQEKLHQEKERLTVRRGVNASIVFGLIWFVALFPACYVYCQAAFVAGQITGSQARMWLETGLSNIGLFWLFAGVVLSLMVPLTRLVNPDRKSRKMIYIENEMKQNESRIEKLQMSIVKNEKKTDFLLKEKQRAMEMNLSEIRRLDVERLSPRDRVPSKHKQKPGGADCAKEQIPASNDALDISSETNSLKGRIEAARARIVAQLQKSAEESAAALNKEK